jgi:ribosomal protein L37AE/L43A
MFGLKGCPHCGKDSTIRRIQSTDDLNWTLIDEDSKELWQCEECTGYFVIEYRAVKITCLEPTLQKING